MILAWLSSRFLGLSRGIWLALVVVALGTLLIALRASENADDRQNQDLGAEQQRARDLTETLNRTEKANDAEETIARDADARLANCRLHSRTPENCR